MITSRNGETDRGMLPREEVHRMVDGTPYWWHSIDLGGGIITRGTKSHEYLQAEVHAMRLPDLRGKTVLDIGAWDGFFSFEAERRGARRVLALDHYVWSLDIGRWNHYLQECHNRGVVPAPHHTVPEVWHPDTLPGKRGFDIAHRALGSRVEAIVADFMEMDLAQIGTFDVVLYLGVLYHMQNPLQALQRVSAVTNELSIIETAAVHVPGFGNASLCEFYETNELAGDTMNWWAPSRTALEGLCRAAGFRKAECLTATPWSGVRSSLRSALAKVGLARRPNFQPSAVCRYRAIAHARK